MALSKVVTISSSQSIYDIALQYYGGIDKVFDVVTDLGLDSIDSDITGKTFTITNETSPFYQYALTKGLTIGSKDSPLLIEPVVLVVYERITEGGDTRITEVGDTRILEE